MMQTAPLPAPCRWCGYRDAATICPICKTPRAAPAAPSTAPGRAPFDIQLDVEDGGLTYVRPRAAR